MIEWFNKWLPIIFGCHCKKERSFYYKGKKFPICARCTGILIGLIIENIIFYFYKFSNILSLLFIIPLIIDGVIQEYFSYESNNRRRFITGVLFSFGLINLFYKSVIFVFLLGYNWNLK